MVVARFNPAAGRPIVYWYGGDALDCPGPGFWYDGDCVQGVTGSDGLILSDMGGDVPIHQTRLVHEMGHWTWYDPHHSDRRIWGADYHDDASVGSYVNDAKNELVDSGR